MAAPNRWNDAKVIVVRTGRGSAWVGAMGIRWTELAADGVCVCDPSQSTQFPFFLSGHTLKRVAKLVRRRPRSNSCLWVGRFSYTK